MGIRLSFVKILEFGGGGIESPQNTPRYATVCLFLKNKVAKKYDKIK
jgi:hypothetical protein